MTRETIHRFIGASLLLLLLARSAAASPDEPGMSVLLDEPGISLRAASPTPSNDGPRFRLDLAFGWSSLVDDPDIKQGYGGGLTFMYGMNHRVGAELTVFFSNNAYAGELGELGDFSSFLAGNISLGPVVQLTRPGSRVAVTAEVALGTYVIVPPVLVQDVAWTLGVSMGTTLSLRLTSWFGVGLKVRYHLFNLSTIAGPELVDRRAFSKIGVIDRFEMPGYVAFFF